MKSDPNKIRYLTYSEMLKLSVVSNTCEDSGLLGSDAVSLGEWFPKFLRIINAIIFKFQVDSFILVVSDTRRLEPSTTQV